MSASDQKPAGRRMKETAEDIEVRDHVYRVTADELRVLVEEIERLTIGRGEVSDQIKEVFARAKARGYDTKGMRRIIALRRKSRDDIEAEDAILHLYREVLGL